MTIDVYNILEYYGDINLNILYEVLHIFPDTTEFTFDGKTYGITKEELYKVCMYWSKILRG
jgi:hypothetical protein